MSGLVTEASTIEALSQKLRDMIPDLLLSNHVISADYAGAIAVHLTSHRQELIEVKSRHTANAVLKQAGLSKAF